MANRSLEERVAILEENNKKLQFENERLHDHLRIQNLMSKYMYMTEAGMWEERLEYIAKKTPGVTVEQGARGVYEGIEGARKSMVDIEKNMELSHARGMKKAFPDTEFPSNHAGMLESFVLGTPVIEVAGDGKTAKGVWVSLMAVGKTYEHVEKPTARWVWWKLAFDFVKEDGEWKIWHSNMIPVFHTEYEKSWVDNAIDRPPRPRPETPGAGHLRTEDFEWPVANRPTTEAYYSNSYSIVNVPKYIPKPPEPYETFDEEESY